MAPSEAETAEAGVSEAGVAEQGAVEAGVPEAGAAEETAAGKGAAGKGTAAKAAPRSVRIPPKPTRAPRKRTPKLDELLAGAVDQARAALETLTGEGEVGEYVGTTAEDDRLVVHRFEATLRGYRGWNWFVSLARAPRSKQLTICETGLLPGPGAIIAPDWVPWSERVSQEEKIRLDAIAAGEDPEKALARARGEDVDGEESAEAAQVEEPKGTDESAPAEESKGGEESEESALTEDPTAAEATEGSTP